MRSLNISLPRRAVVCLVAFLLFIPALLSGCKNENAPVQGPAKYVYANTPYYVNGLATTLFCRIDVEAGVAYPMCNDPVCDHFILRLETSPGGCSANQAQTYDISPDGRTVVFKNSGVMPNDEAADVIYSYSVDTGEIKEIARFETNNHNDILAMDDRIIYNVVSVNSVDPETEKEDYVNRYYMYKDGGSVLLKELDNEIMHLETSRDRIVQRKYTETEDGIKGEFTVYDNELNRLFVAEEYTDAFPDYKNYISWQEDGEVYFISDLEGLIKMPERYDPITTLDDYVVYSVRPESYEVEHEENGDPIIPPELVTVYTIDIAHGERRQLFCGADDETAKEFGMDRITSFEFINYTPEGGPKSGNKLLLIIGGYVHATDQYGNEYRAGVDVPVIFDALTGGMTFVDNGDK